jgi:hypothetical protein
VPGERTTWAFVIHETFARVAPTREASAVAPLHPISPLDSREVVVVLDRATSDGDEWLLVELPVAPNGTTGWVPRPALDELRVTERHLFVDTVSLDARLFRGRDELWSGPIGVGTPDWATPTGRFYVRARMVPSRDTPLYGAFAFVTSCIAREPWPGGCHLGIHGTNRPDRIPGHVSKGCIRMRDDDVLQLRPMLPLGARVTIV